MSERRPGHSAVRRAGGALLLAGAMALAGGAVARADGPSDGGEAQADRPAPEAPAGPEPERDPADDPRVETLEIRPGWDVTRWFELRELSYREEPDAYETPRAGQAVKLTLFGQRYFIDARDRGTTNAVSLGTAVYHPSLGDQSWSPLFALYFRRIRPTWRMRAILSGFYNDLEGAAGVGRGFEVAGSFENYTVPFNQVEVLDGSDLKDTAVRWGEVKGQVGFGYRIAVPPYRVDNDVSIHLGVGFGYFYAQRVHDTRDSLRLPPDTITYSLRARLRYDGLQRNLMELPHSGIAFGFDAALVNRDRWSDHGAPELVSFEKDSTKLYAFFSAYAVLALRLPFLSDHHHFVGYAHGGLAGQSTLDRYSAFRIGGGPFPSESGDLDRHPYPGALFNQVPTSDYILLTLEYRLELLFFLYLHIRGTLAWGRRPTLEKDNLDELVDFTRDRGEAVSVALTSGFVWESVLYAEISFDTGQLRNGEKGVALLAQWSKSF